MGRGKIEIKRLEPASHRNSTCRIRFKGLCKKAEELSVLCDVPVMLLVTEPTDKQKLCLNGNRMFEQIVQQFANASKESLDEENKHCIEVLERAYKKDDHVVDVRSLMHNGVRQAKVDENFEGKKELEMIEEEISKIEEHLSPLRCIGGLEKINSIDQLEGFEKSLTELFSLNERKKALLLEKQKNGHHHLPTPYEGDPGCSTSTAAVLHTAPLSSSHITPLYGRDPRCSTTTEAALVVPTSPLPSYHIAPLYERNMTEAANSSVSVSSLNPQNGGLREEAGLEEYPQNGNLLEEAGSKEYFQNGILPEEEEYGSEYMQKKYDEESSSIVNLHLHSPTHEDYSLFFY